MPPPGKRGKYLGFVAHELKNPLATALWSSDLLKRMDSADRAGERAEKMIDVSLRALRRMRRLIDDFFTIERLMEHGYELKRERVSLKDLVEPAMHALAEKDGIATDGWRMELGDVSTMGDPDMLRRAVRAALEHMARPSQTPRLSLAVRMDGLRPALHIHAVIQPRMPHQVSHRSTHARLLIVRAKHELPHLRQDNGAGALRARLERHVERAVGEAVSL